MAVVLSTVDLYYFKQELISQLLGAKIEQIYQHDPESLTIRFYKSGLGKVDLFVSPPKAIYLTTNKPASSQELYGFCGILRKYLPNTTLTKVEQLGFSRTLKLDFEFKTESKFSLVIELYDKGNIILLDRDLKILSVLSTQRWQNRLIAAGQQYEIQLVPFPQDISSDELKRLVDEAAKEQMTTSKFTTTKFGLGKTYGALLCSIADISPNIIISLDEAKKLQSSLKILFSQKLSPVTLSQDGKIVSVFPFSHPKLENTVPIESLSQAYEKTLLLHDKPVVNPKLAASKTAQKKLQNILDAQKASINSLLTEISDNKQIGDSLYQNHAEYDQLLAQVKKLIQTVKEPELSVQLKLLNISKYDLQKKTIVLEKKE